MIVYGFNLQKPSRVMRKKKHHSQQAVTQTNLCATGLNTIMKHIVMVTQLHTKHHQKLSKFSYFREVVLIQHHVFQNLHVQ